MGDFLRATAIAVSLLAPAVLAATPAEAAVELSWAPAAGTNPNRIIVGQQFSFNMLMSGPAGDSFLSGGGGIFSADTNIRVDGITFAPGYNADFSTNPALLTFTMTALAEGPAYLAASGQRVTTVGGQTFTNLSPGTIRFNILPASAAVPEPASWALMILGFGAIGYAMRRRPKVRFNFA